MLRKIPILPVLALGLGLASFVSPASAQTTGFNQTGAGPFDYNTPGNWVGGTVGDINGIWDSSLTLAGTQTTEFGADTALATGLSFLYNSTNNLILRGTGANRTITLGGDILHNTVSANRTITIGSTTALQGLNVDLGATARTITVNGAAGTDNIRFLNFLNNVTNGSLTLNGGGWVSLDGTANSLTSLRLQNTNLRLTGVSATNSLTTVSGSLIIDGNSTSGGASIISITPNAARNTTLTANSLVRDNSGVAFFRGNNLGGTLGANGVSNIVFSNAPTAQLVGGGGLAGSKNISILPWAVGSTTAGGAAETFVTYGPNGVRPLAASEFEVYASGFSGAATGTDLNTRIASLGTVTFTGNNTVNSLFVGDGSSSGVTTFNGDGGVLTVTSGAVFFQRANVSQNLNFGVREGVIGFTQGQGSTYSGGIAGSGGLTLYQPATNVVTFGAGTGITLSGSSSYTGDTNILGRVQITNANFLPNGSRTGNVIVEGRLELTTSTAINGLSGGGEVRKEFSGAGINFTVGGNDADGNFTGVITNNSALTLIKTGVGTQILAGANTYTGGTTVNAGTLLINGSISSGNVSVTAGTLGGAGNGTTTGIIAGATTLSAGAKLSPGTAVGLAGNLTFSNGLNLSASSNDTGAYLFNLGSMASSDRITLTTVTANALNVGTLDTTDFTFTTGLGFGVGTYVLFDANSAIAGSVGAGVYNFGGGFTGSLSFGGSNDVLLTVVPEPSAMLLLTGGLMAVTLLRRRRHNG